MVETTDIVAIVTAVTALGSVMAKILIDKRLAASQSVSADVELRELEARLRNELWQQVQTELADEREKRRQSEALMEEMQARLDRMQLELDRYQHYTRYLWTIIPASVNALTYNQWHARNYKD